MTTALLVLLFALNPVELVVREQVDLIELNHFYDEQGKLVFDQLLFYDWNRHDERFQVRAWRLVKNHNPIPERDWSVGGYTALWQDGEVARRIWAASFRETWTQDDPELQERAMLPKEQRLELLPPWRKVP